MTDAYWLLPSTFTVVLAGASAVFAGVRQPLDRWGLASGLGCVAVGHGAYIASLLDLTTSSVALRIAFAAHGLFAAFVLILTHALMGRLESKRAPRPQTSAIRRMALVSRASRAEGDRSGVKASEFHFRRRGGFAKAPSRKTGWAETSAGAGSRARAPISRGNQYDGRSGASAGLELADSSSGGFPWAPLGAGLTLVGLLALPTSWFELPQGVAGGLVGQLASGGRLVLSLFALAGVEQLLRRLREPLRYQSKFVLLGLGLLLVIDVYTTSTFLLRGQWHPRLSLAHSSVAVLALSLVAMGLFRLRQRTAWRELAPASSNRSVSFVIAGAFLLVMGIASALLPRGATVSGYVLGVTLASATGVGFAVLLASRYVRTQLAKFISRTFQRSKYDYRRAWLEVIDEFHGATTVDTILDRLVDLLGKSFAASRISVWLRSDTDSRFHQVRSINLETPPSPLDPEHPLVAAASVSREVLRWHDLRLGEDEFVRSTHVRIVGPLWGGGLLGLVVLGEDLRNSDYDQDDIDLLQAVSHHAGVLIAHSRLTAQHRADAEARALHELSIFCIHDLKNLAGRLSLVAQNAKRFGDNPEFQQSALRTVATTVERMTSLIHKLSAGAEAPCLQPPREARADLFEALATATETVKEGVRIQLPPSREPRPLVRMPMDGLVNVLLNVITNAEQAIQDEGTITIGVEESEDDEWKISIRDDGPGIEPSTLNHLFEPFRSTRASGLGVGLYHCRKAVDAAGGSILVDSKVGFGTIVRLHLPAVPQSSEEP